MKENQLLWWLIGIVAALAVSSSANSHSRAATPLSPSLDGAARTLTYRSRDGRAFFRFGFSPIGGGIRIHILEFPNPGIGSCHVLHDSRGPYVCWSAPVRSMEAAKAVALMWAEATLLYQRNGRAF